MVFLGCFNSKKQLPFGKKIQFMFNESLFRKILLRFLFFLIECMGIRLIKGVINLVAC